MVKGLYMTAHSEPSYNAILMHTKQSVQNGPSFLSHSKAYSTLTLIICRKPSKPPNFTWIQYYSWDPISITNPGNSHQNWHSSSHINIRPSYIKHWIHPSINTFMKYINLHSPLDCLNVGLSILKHLSSRYDSIFRSCIQQSNQLTIHTSILSIHTSIHPFIHPLIQSSIHP